LTNNTGQNTGHGIDRYALELSKRINSNNRVTVLNQGNLSNGVYWALNELIQPIKILSVHANVYHAVSQQIAKSAIFAMKRPLVTTIHDLIPFQNSLTSFYEDRQIHGDSVRFKYMQLCTLMAAKSDLIIAPFDVTIKDIVSRLHVSTNKIRKVSYGVDTNFFSPLKLTTSDKEKKRGKKIVFFVGGFNPRKGIDKLMEAFPSVIKEQPNVELWICGKWNFFDGGALAKKLGIADYIKVLGHVPDSMLPLYYNLADLVVLPYRIGFSLPVLEAMACGRAVITSDTADLKELVGGFVETICPTDEEKLAEAINCFLSDDSKREEVGKRAYAKARTLSWDRMAQRTMDVYSELT
jgi:glycosyltransferase involved in cell wall biosynthesis